MVNILYEIEYTLHQISDKIMLFCHSPFYRTEMLIITAKNSSQWLRDDPAPSVLKHLYGPVLRKEILHEVRI